MKRCHGVLAIVVAAASVAMAQQSRRSLPVRIAAISLHELERFELDFEVKCFARLAFTPDGDSIAVSTDHFVAVVDLHSAEIERLEGDTVTEGRADAELLIGGSRPRLIDSRDGSLVDDLPHSGDGPSSWIGWVSPRGDAVVMANRFTIGLPTVRFSGFGDRDWVTQGVHPMAIRWSRDGKWLATVVSTASCLIPHHLALAVRRADGTVVAERTGSFYSACTAEFSPTARTLVWSDDRTVRLVTVPELKEIETATAAIRFWAFLDEVSALSHDGHEFSVWFVPRLERVKTWLAPWPCEPARPVPAAFADLPADDPIRGLFRERTIRAACVTRDRSKLAVALERELRIYAVRGAATRTETR